MIDYEYADLFYGSHAKTWIFTCIDPDVQLTFSNDDIVQESISLERGMCETDFFTYGTYSSNSIRVSVFKTEEHFKGKRFLVDVVLDNHTEAPLTVGTFTCESDNLSSDRRSRELVMYDDLYKLSELDVAQWYNHYWDDNDDVTLIQFRLDFFEDCLGIECEGYDTQGTTLANDFVVIKKAANFRTLSASTVLKSILQVNCVNACMSNVNTLKWVRIKEYYIHGAPPQPLVFDIVPDITLDTSKFYNCNYEEYQVWNADSIGIIIDPDNMILYVDGGTSPLPTHDNFLYISYDNMFFRDLDMDGLHSFINSALYGRVRNRIAFTPAQIQMRGNLCYEPGDVVQVDIDGKTIYTVIIKQTITGVQGLTMTLSCRGDERFSNPLSVESASYDDYAGAENQGGGGGGGGGSHSNTAWKLRSSVVDDDSGERYYTYLTQNKHFVVSNDEVGGHNSTNDRTEECTIGQSANPWKAGYFKDLFMDGARVVANFPEIIRNIGYRLLDEPTGVDIDYDPLYERVLMTWADPMDISTNEPVTATWAGTVVVRNDERKPLHRWDGELIVNSTTLDEYSETELYDGDVEVGTTYYYGIFPYDTRGWYRYTKVVSITPFPMPIPDIISLYASGTTVTVEYSIPSEYTWSQIGVVCKKDAIPADKTDGRVMDITNAGGIADVIQLAPESLYYFRIFSTESTSSKEFISEAQSVITGQREPTSFTEVISITKSGGELFDVEEEVIITKL